MAKMYYCYQFYYQMGKSLHETLEVKNTNYNLVSISKIKEAYKGILCISLNSNLVSHWDKFERNNKKPFDINLKLFNSVAIIKVCQKMDLCQKFYLLDRNKKNNEMPF